MAEVNARWRQIHDDLRRRLLAGEWEPGQQMPTLDELNQEYGCNGPMMRRALRPLQDRGVIDRRHGVGNFVIDPQRARSDDVQGAWRELEEAIGVAEIALRRVKNAADTLRTA